MVKALSIGYELYIIVDRIIFLLLCEYICICIYACYLYIYILIRRKMLYSRPSLIQISLIRTLANPNTFPAPEIGVATSY